MKKFLEYAVHLYSVIFIIAIISTFIMPLVSCKLEPKQITNKELLEFFSKNRVGPSPDYAVVKNGHDYLILVYGYANDYDTCLQIIEPYNNDPNLSILPGTYQCLPLNSEK